MCCVGACASNLINYVPHCVTASAQTASGVRTDFRVSILPSFVDPQARSSAEPQSRLKHVLADANADDETPNYCRHGNGAYGQTGVFLGNWGIRATNPDGARLLVHMNNQMQILKNPCDIVLLAEASELTCDELKGKAKVPEWERITKTKFDDRSPHNDHYYAFRGPQAHDVLIAVRKSAAENLRLLESRSRGIPFKIRQNGKDKDHPSLLNAES
mgnify:FL=1